MRFSVTDDICFMTAVELATKIAGKELSAREVMTAHLDQISRINPQVNAIVSKLDDDQALALADEADRKQASGAPLGPLHGLPTAFKDLEDATGFPTSMGSPLFAGTMPAHDSILVERIRAAGAIGIGKTNVPEFGLGSHSFNPVFGVTRNPYNLNKTAGGSSGGAGACPGDRHAADRRWQRHGRLAAQSGQFQQRRRFSPILGTRAEVAELPALDSA